MARRLKKRALLVLLPLAVGAGIAAEMLAARRRFSLDGKNAVVTGGARGLGLEIARVLVRKGAHVVIVARDEAEVARGLADLRSSRRDNLVRVLGETCDLRDGDAVEAMMTAARALLGPIDVLVNNAGAIQVGPLDAMNVADFDEAMSIHFSAPLRAMLAVRDDMRGREGGRIANIASVGGLVSVPHLLPYCASKFALVGLSEGMRAELARDKILVSTIAPGLMRTGSPRNALFKGDHTAEHAWFTLSDSLPLLSMSSARAARRIVRAIERGEPHVVLGLPAKIAAIAHGLAPGWTMRALTMVTRALPRGNDPRARAGFESECVTRSVLTWLTDRAAARNNE